MFYDARIDKGKLKYQKNEKFYFFPEEFIFNENNLEETETNEDNIFYKVINEERLILIENNNAQKNNNPVTIIVKDRYNKKIIYQMEVRKENDKLIGNGIVKDFRTGELFLVNFDTNNIISNDILKDIPQYKDKEEFQMCKKSKKCKKNEFILDPTKEIQCNNIIDIKKENLNFDKYLKVFEALKQKLYKKITEKKIEYLGIKDQKFLGECWAHSLVLLLYYAEARKYGRKLENFEEIYKLIKNHFGCGGKPNEEREEIMHFCKIFPDDENFNKEKYLNNDYNKDIPNFGLHYKRLDPKDELEINNYIKKGIKCLLSFGLNNLEWDNFCNYFGDETIKSEEKT